MLDFHQDCLNLVENVVVLDFDHRFKDMAPALPCICRKVMRLQSTKNGERRYDLQKAHNEM